MFKKIMFLVCFLYASNIFAAQEILYDPTETEINLSLTAIVINDKERFCVINNVVMTIGSEICDYLVTKIENNKVILQDSNEKLIILKLN